MGTLSVRPRRDRSCSSRDARAVRRLRGGSRTALGAQATHALPEVLSRDQRDKIHRGRNHRCHVLRLSPQEQPFCTVSSLRCIKRRRHSRNLFKLLLTSCLWPRPVCIVRLRERSGIPAPYHKEDTARTSADRYSIRILSRKFLPSKFESITVRAGAFVPVGHSVTSLLGPD